jgi:acetyl-CoA carboxylase/biotin carboxylase 1
MLEAENFFGSVEEFVTFSNGDHAIKKILVANNGIGALKAIRSIRRWSFETFGNERMVSKCPSNTACSTLSIP